VHGIDLLIRGFDEREDLRRGDALSLGRAARQCVAGQGRPNEGCEQNSSEKNEGNGMHLRMSFLKQKPWLLFSQVRCDLSISSNAAARAFPDSLVF
jgi:hypothetical protein